MQMSFTSTEKHNIKENDWMEIERSFPLTKWDEWQEKYYRYWWMKIIIKFFPIKYEKRKEKYQIINILTNEIHIEDLKGYEYIITTKD